MYSYEHNNQRSFDMTDYFISHVLIYSSELKTLLPNSEIIIIRSIIYQSLAEKNTNIIKRVHSKQMIQLVFKTLVASINLDSTSN